MKQLWLFNQINTDLQKVEQELAQFISIDYPILKDSAVHLLKAGGKRLRPAFTLLTGQIYGYQIEKILPVAVALELIHMASLVHDDVVDASMTRRGRPTVTAQWGNVVSVQTGDYLLAKSLVLISQINHPRISQILAEVSVEMSQGEIQQIKTSYDIHQSLQDYYYRIKRKTALLISASCELGAIITGAPQRHIWALKSYGHALGMAFQIMDDILDITAKPSEFGKPVGGDIKQGIMTLPMILALQLSPERKRLAELLGKVEKSPDEIREAIRLIKESGGVEESLRWVDVYIEKAKKYLTEIPNTPQKKALVEMAEFLRERKF